MNTIGLILSVIAYTIAVFYVSYKAGFKHGFCEAVDACQKIVDTLTEGVRELSPEAGKIIDSANSQKKQ